MAEENNKVLKEAAVECEYLTGEEEVQRLAFLRRKFELDYNSGLQYAEEKGMKKGIEKGIKKGSKEKQKEIAKKMKEKNMNMDTIIEITDLSEEEIEKL